MGCEPGELGYFEFIAVAVGVWFVAWLLRFFMMFQQLLRMTFHSIAYQPIDALEVPAHLSALYRSTIAQLEQLGFVGAGFLRLQRLAGFPEPHTSTPALMRHRELGVCALVDVSPAPDKWRPVSVTFWSFLDSGRAVMTVSGMRGMILDTLPETEMVDPYAATIAEQWHAHLQALDSAGRDRVRQLDPEAMVGAIQAREAAYVEDLLKRGRLRPREQGEGYELPVAAAIGLAWQAVGAQKKLRRMYARIARTEPRPPTLPLEEEVTLFERLERLRRMPGRRRVYLGLFALTALLFTGSMALLFDATMVVMLSVVVLVHELGHYAAMRAFGYADTTIFFLPFLGAATTGRRDGAPAGHELVIFLAGPVPGLVLAYLIGTFYAASPGSWQQQALLVLVIVNLFNLLPIFPLDGGRVLHLLIFRRNRWLEAAFMTLAGLALFASGLRLQSTLLAVIGVAVGLTVPHRLRLAHLLGLLRNEERSLQTQPESPEEGRHRRVFRLLDGHGYRGGTLARRFAMARGLLQRQAERTAGAGAVIVGLLAYGAALMAGLVLLVQVATPQSGGDGGSELSQAAATRLAKPPTELRAVACDELPNAASMAQAEATHFGMNLYVECALPSEELARATVGTLKNFFSAAPRFTDLRPPWIDTGLPPAKLHAQERARATYRRLQGISQRAAVEQVDTGTFYRRVLGCGDAKDPAELQAEVNARAARIRQQRVAAVRRYLDSPNARALDPEIARLYLELVGAKPDQEVLQALAERMGRLPPEAAPTSAPADPGAARAADSAEPVGRGTSGDAAKTTGGAISGDEAEPADGAPSGDAANARAIAQARRLRPTALGEVHRDGAKLVLPYLWLPDAASRADLLRYLCLVGCRDLRVAALRQEPEL
jgi:Zn-dependent protease